MFYKIMYENNVIDLLDRLIYVKYQESHGILVLCDVAQAEAVLSSDGNFGWHLDGLCSFIPDSTVYAIKEIPPYEYERLKKLELKTKKQIEDTLILELVGRGVL